MKEKISNPARKISSKYDSAGIKNCKDYKDYNSFEAIIYSIIA